MSKFIPLLFAALLCGSMVGCKDDSNEAAKSAPHKERQADNAKKF